eukprot:CAMPEP_0185559654 /NCGR_PEP_ID=MMETSP1381-20130426/55041_1 /TAXON_ID=298111 /ORGANISM="Pavlova sp., Strain CCMP459" /LENGTH=61 /DNA_ID=CAMNT_0028173287 /DNA_START=19 /DNA_END=200 /DNA_ORIENTATION=-
MIAVCTGRRTSASVHYVHRRGDGTSASSRTTLRAQRQGRALRGQPRLVAVAAGLALEPEIT